MAPSGDQKGKLDPSTIHPGCYPSIQIPPSAATDAVTMTTNTISSTATFVPSITSPQEEVWQDSNGQNILDRFSLTATHEVMEIPLGQQRRVMKVMSMQQLSPLDMIYSSSELDGEGREGATPAPFNDGNDGTGHLVWLAALAFIYLLEEGGENGEASLLQDLFDHRRIVELGCGTGAASIATLLLTRPQYLVMTDADPQALQLSRKNCQINHLDGDFDGLYQIVALEWGNQKQIDNAISLLNTFNDKADHHHPQQSPPFLFDTVLATDVIYDLKLIQPLLETVVRLLPPGGHFVLSHVPRFCLPDNENKDSNNLNDATTDTEGLTSSSLFSTTTTTTATKSKLRSCPFQRLERHITECAQSVGLELQQLIRPDQVLVTLPETKQSSISRPSSSERRRGSNSRRRNHQGSLRQQSSPIITLEELRQAHAVLMVFVRPS